MSETNLIKNKKLFLDEKPSVYALRQKAKKTLIEKGLPTKKTESWKYTDITQIINNNFNIIENSNCSHDCCCKNKNNETFIDISFCNGFLHIEEYNLPKGVTIKSLIEILYENEYKNYIQKSYSLENCPFAALNGIYLEQGICVLIEKNSNITKPIKINYNISQNDFQQNIHNIIILEKNSTAEIIEIFNTNQKRYLTNIVNEIYLEKEAKLNHYKKQAESIDSYHIALNSIKQKEASVYKQFYISQGAKISRNENLINLDQTFASASIFSAYRTNKNCTTDITTNINHNCKNTASTQITKGILTKDSSATFQGKIYIEKNSIQSTGNQLHKALYLDESAKLNCKPELEIYTDDVKCSHGASCGDIDKEQIFYLTSRGIDEKTAINMLTEAFLNEIYELIPNKEVANLLF